MSTINSNLQSLVGAHNLSRTQEMLGRSLSRLSSGSKIVAPSDDAAGLAVSEKIGAQSLRLQAASTNIQNAVSYAQTSDGFLNSMGKIVSRLGELVNLAQDPTKSASDVDLYDREFQSLQQQLRDTIGGTTAEIGGTSDVSAPLGSFNGTVLFGSHPSGTTITIGAIADQTLTLDETNLRQGAMLSLIAQDSSGNFTFSLDDSNAFATADAALQQIAGQRATLGGSLSRLDVAAATLTVEQQNLTAAVSRIRDVDVAAESTQFAKYNILSESGTAMLAQSNDLPRSVLKLLES